MKQLPVVPATVVGTVATPVPSSTGGTGIQQVLWTAADGRRFQVMVPKGAPVSNYHMGVVVGPPDLGSLGLPTAVEVRLHNQLHDRGLLKGRDLQRRPNEVFAALQSALRVDVAAIANLYGQEKEGR